MPTQPPAEETDARDPYYYINWALAALAGLMLLWALTPWFPWK